MLIAGSGPELIMALADEAERRGIKTASSIISENNAQRRPANEKTTPLEWNPCSPISARSLVLAAENRIGPLDAGIIVCAAANSAEMRDFSPAGIDFVVNNHIKSYMFLTHELTRSFRARQSGALVFVLLEGPAQGILAAPVSSAFKSFSNSMLARSNTEYQSTLAFSCEEKNISLMNEFAAYIFKILTENKKPDRARWFKFTKLKMHPPASLIQGIRDGKGIHQALNTVLSK
jgi:hypothetical protein